MIFSWFFSDFFFLVYFWYFQIFFSRFFSDFFRKSILPIKKILPKRFGIFRPNWGLYPRWTPTHPTIVHFSCTTSWRFIRSLHRCIPSHFCIFVTFFTVHDFGLLHSSQSMGRPFQTPNDSHGIHFQFWLEIFCGLFPSFYAIFVCNCIQKGIICILRLSLVIDVHFYFSNGKKKISPLLKFKNFDFDYFCNF